MKKTLSLFVALVMMLGSGIAAADVDFDPAQYSIDQLEEIQRIIAGYLPRNLEGQVLYDQDDLYIECKGIALHQATTWVINLYVDNKTNDEVYIALGGGKANGCIIKISSAKTTVLGNSVYLADPNFDNLISVSALRDYGITNLTSVEFDIEVRKGDKKGDILLQSPIKIDTDIPVEVK